MSDLGRSERKAGTMVEAERVEIYASADPSRGPRTRSEKPPEEDLLAHQFPAKGGEMVERGEQPAAEQPVETQQQRQSAEEDRERERRIYRGRTVGMLRRYLRYSIETGRLPSLLGAEFFRAKVTAYTVVTFEDRVIFVHDMERCLDRLDDFSRQLIARHILQEHDRWATARLLHCNEKTVRRYTPVVLDVLSEVLLEVGLMERLEGGREFDGLEESRTRSGESMRRNSCQGGKRDAIDASDCGDEEYKV